MANSRTRNRCRPSQHYSYPSVAIDCFFFVFYGTCGFGENCRFNHPVRGHRSADHRQAMLDNMHAMYSCNPCKFFLAGICKYGSSCMYDHRLPSPLLNFSLHFNALGLPKRWGEQDCYFYMRTGVCGYGTACRYHHPEPVLYYPYQGYGPYVGGEAVQYQNGYTRIDNGWIPQRVSITIKEPSVTLNDIGLPLRPEKNLCRNYEGTGRCRYGRGCKFNHPMKQP